MGIATSQRRQAPNRFASSASFTRSRLASAPLWPSSLEIAALFTSMSSLPNSSSTERASLSTLSGSATSNWWTTTPSGSSAAASRPCSASLEPSTTVMPRSESWRHTSSPIPRFPPLTSATRPFSIARPPIIRTISKRNQILPIEEPERCFDRLLRRGAHHHVLAEIPPFEHHYAAPNLPGKRYLRERSILAPHSDDNIPGTHHGQVPRLPHPRRHRVGKVFVLPTPILVGQDAYRRATRLCSPT